ncbi:MAG: hypothetical protein ACKV2V_14025 [Blastocatellia bacterium]
MRPREIQPAGAAKGTAHSGSALVVNATGTNVLVARPDPTVHVAHVEIGRDLGKEIEITHSLAAADKIIGYPTDEMHEGRRVQINARQP